MRLLAAYDARYFSLWVQYWDRLLKLRAAGASAEDEERLVREVFTQPPSAGERLLQLGRNVKARLRYDWWRWRAGAG
jgi:hypothetical protein